MRDSYLVFVNRAGKTMHTDPIADMLTRIRNASRVKKQEVIMPFSKLKMVLAEVLKAEGYIAGVEKIEDAKPQLKVTLKYHGDRAAIAHIARVSTPGFRKYVGKDDLPVIRNHYGVAILSTSKGVMTNKQAKEQGVGGEILCELY